jgi:rhodanese-related sulfurtransferase
MVAAERLYVVDLRTTLDNDWPPIPGAVRLSLENLTSTSNQIPRDREIILYCTCPNEASSARAALILRSHGMSRCVRCGEVQRRGLK